MSTNTNTPATNNADELKKRIRAHVERELTKPCYSTNYFIKKELVEEIIKRPVEDAIAEIVCGQDEIKSSADLSTRRRNSLERDRVHMAARMFLGVTFPPELFTADELRAFLKRFYRAGDDSLHQAAHRALREAVAA